MPEIVANTANAAGIQDRRAHARVELKSNVYVDLGDGTFGVLTDIGDGGLGLRTAGPLMATHIPTMLFRLSPVGKFIRPSGHVAWRTASKTSVGVQFEAMPPAAWTELKSWVATELARGGPGRGAQRPPAPSVQNAAASAQIAPAAPEVFQLPDASPTHRGAGPDTGAGSPPIREFVPRSSVSTPAAESAVAAKDAASIPAANVSSNPSLRIASVAAPPHSESSPAAESTPEKPPQPKDDLEHLKQLVVDSTAETVVNRKQIQWAVAAVLSLALIFSEIALWRWATGEISGPDGDHRAETALSGAAAQGPFEIDVLDSRNRQWIVREGGSPEAVVANSSRPSNAASLKDSPAGSTQGVAAAAPNQSPRYSSNVASLASLASFRCSGKADGAPSFSSAAAGQNATVQESSERDGTPVFTIEPTYPISDAQSCVEGTVRLHATIDAKGIVRSLNPVSGPPTLFESAMAAARYWRFQPAVRQGQPVETDRDINVVFRNILAETR